MCRECREHKSGYFSVWKREFDQKGVWIESRFHIVGLTVNFSYLARECVKIAISNSKPCIFHDLYILRSLSGSTWKPLSNIKTGRVYPLDVLFLTWLLFTGLISAMISCHHSSLMEIYLLYFNYLPYDFACICIYIKSEPCSHSNHNTNIGLPITKEGETSMVLNVWFIHCVYLWGGLKSPR